MSPQRRSETSFFFVLAHDMYGLRRRNGNQDPMPNGSGQTATSSGSLVGLVWTVGEAAESLLVVGYISSEVAPSKPLVVQSCI